MYLYRAIDSIGDTVEFQFSERRDLPPANRFFKRWSAMAGPIASSSMAARLTRRRSFPATRQINCRIALGAD